MQLVVGRTRREVGETQHELGEVWEKLSDSKTAHLETRNEVRRRPGGAKR